MTTQDEFNLTSIIIEGMVQFKIPKIVIAIKNNNNS